MRMPLVVAVLAWSATSPLYSAGMTPVERARLVSHLEVTRDWLIDEVSGLSQAQLDFRPAPGVWSVMEVVEHLVVVGPIYWNDLQKALKGKPGKPAPNSPSNGDADILWYGIDRSRPEKAIPSELAPGRLRDLAEGLKSYRAQHARLLEYAKTTNDDLRSHVVERQLCDAYQWALLISTHEQRHVLQIRELKKHPSFPKK
jgi:DinB superfamily